MTHKPLSSFCKATELDRPRAAACCEYKKNKFPLKYEVRVRVEVVHINRRKKCEIKRLVVLSEIKFPYLIPEGASIDILLEQMSSYKMHGIDEEVCDKERINESWRSIGALIDDHDRDVKLYIQLSKVMLGILTIPHNS